MAGTEWPRAFEFLSKRQRGAVCRYGRVDLQAFGIAQFEHCLPGMLLEEGAKLAEPRPLDGDPGRHGMSAALDQQAAVDRLAHHAPKVEAGDGAAGAGADAGRVEGDGEGRPPRMVLQPRRKQADDARMPFVVRGDEHGRPLPSQKFRVGFRLRLGEHPLLHRLALGIQPIQRLGDLGRLHRVVKRQQPAAKRGVADTAARIDTGADHEAEMVGIERLADARGARQGRNPRIGHPPCRDQPFHDKGTIEPDERHHVADRRQRNQVEHGKEIRRRRTAGFA